MISKDDARKLCIAFIELLKQNMEDSEVHIDSVNCWIDDPEEIIVQFNSVEYGRCGDTDILDHHIWVSVDEILEKAKNINI